MGRPRPLPLGLKCRRGKFIGRTSQGRCECSTCALYVGGVGDSTSSVVLSAIDRLGRRKGGNARTGCRRGQEHGQSQLGELHLCARNLYSSCLKYLRCCLCVKLLATERVLLFYCCSIRRLLFGMNLSCSVSIVSMVATSLQ